MSYVRDILQKRRQSGSVQPQRDSLRNSTSKRCQPKREALLQLKTTLRCSYPSCCQTKVTAAPASKEA